MPINTAHDDEYEYDGREGARGAESAREDSKNGVKMQSRTHLGALGCSLAYIEGYEQTYLLIINERRWPRRPLTLDEVSR